jgi:hypothetical protein
MTHFGLDSHAGKRRVDALTGFFALTAGESAMTRLNFDFMLRRAYEHFVASAGAIAVTVLLLMSVDARAETHRSLTPSVTILVPTVAIEVLDGVNGDGV